MKKSKPDPTESEWLACIDAAIQMMEEACEIINGERKNRQSTNFSKDELVNLAGNLMKLNSLSVTVWMTACSKR